MTVRTRLARLEAAAAAPRPLGAPYDLTRLTDAQLERLEQLVVKTGPDEDRSRLTAAENAGAEALMARSAGKAPPTEAP